MRVVQKSREWILLTEQFVMVTNRKASLERDKAFFFQIEATALEYHTNVLPHKSESFLCLLSIRMPSTQLLVLGAWRFRTKCALQN